MYPSLYPYLNYVTLWLLLKRVRKRDFHSLEYILKLISAKGMWTREMAGSAPSFMARRLVRLLTLQPLPWEKHKSQMEQNGDSITKSQAVPDPYLEAKPSKASPSCISHPPLATHGINAWNKYLCLNTIEFCDYLLHNVIEKIAAELMQRGAWFPL